MNLDRRKFLQLCGVSASGLLLPSGLALAAPLQESPSAQANGMLSDLTKCIGCGWCQQACEEWNDLPARQRGQEDTCLSADIWTVPELEVVEENGQQ